MKAFSFNLQKVLDLRKFHEEEAKIELGRAVGALAELEGKVVTLGEERAKAANEQISPGNSPVTIQQYMYYILRLDQYKGFLLSEIETAKENVDKARELYLEASRERKVLDKLKEKRQAEHKKQMLVEETKALDDISAQIYARNEN